MNFKSLAYLPLVLIATTVSGQSLYLTCKATTFPDMDFKKIYKSPPPNPRDQFIQDMIVEGLVGILLNKAETWEIKTAERSVTSPDENSGPKFANATITDTKVSATATSPNGKNNFWYELNRITGKLTYQIDLAEEETKAWRSKHGGQLPRLWKWEQSCTSSSRPRI
jgi:hypothetical protein